MSLQFGVNIPVQRHVRPCHCLCLLSSKQTVPYLCLVSTTKQQARLAKQLGYGTRLRGHNSVYCVQITAGFGGSRTVRPQGPNRHRGSMPRPYWGLPFLRCPPTSKLWPFTPLLNALMSQWISYMKCEKTARSVSVVSHQMN